jgi:VTC domain
MTNRIETSFANFDSIGLADLNAKAEMLARIDNKYILTADKLAFALESFGKIFDVLDIEGIRGFSYSTIYFDDAELRGYYDHHQRKRKRCKARIRSYVDSDLHYLEVKLNDRRSTTLKKRLRLEQPMNTLNAQAFDFIDDCHQSVYAEPFRKVLNGAIHIKYTRYTLVAKDGGERMTLDTDVSFCSGGVTATPPADMFIIETKSARGNGIADKILRGLHVKPTKRVSKYCIGLAATGQVKQHNGFLPALRRLQLVDTEAQAPLVFPVIEKAVLQRNWLSTWQIPSLFGELAISEYPK